MRDWTRIPRGEFTAEPAPVVPRVAPPDPVGTAPLFAPRPPGGEPPSAPPAAPVVRRVVELPGEAVEWIRATVLPRGAAQRQGPHHGPIWGAECSRCPPAVCHGCQGGYHGRCDGRSYGWYPEASVLDARGVEIPGDRPWEVLRADWSRVWLPGRCGCGCERQPARTQDAPAPGEGWEQVPLPVAFPEPEPARPVEATQGALF